MKYRELKIFVNREHLETTEAALIAAGFSAMQIDDPLDAKDIAEHPDAYKYDYLNDEIISRSRDDGGEVTVTLYFADDEEGRAREAEACALLDELRAQTGAEGLRYEASLTGDDSEWLYKWQENFRPTKAGERIVVKPGWEDYEAKPGELIIEMEPGMAFGSGLHATTSMCIKALEKYMRARGDTAREDGAWSRSEAAGADPCPGSVRVLDVGTGTGILAIAAALLGADDCLGIDIDDEAVRVGTENVARNGLADRIDIIKGDLTEGVSYDADVIAANLMADLVIRLSPAAARHLRPGGIYITSGILDIKEETVSEAIRDAGFRILEVMSDGEWRAVVAERL